MARTIKELEAQTDAKLADIDSKLDKLADMVAQLAAAPKGQAKAEAPKPKAKPLVDACPEYATAAQRVEYDKLAERARKQRDQVAKALGTESLSCFIPVSRTADRMPHTIKWSATYSK